MAKYLGNTQGDFTLVAEVFAAELAMLIGVKVPDFALLNGDAEDLGGITRRLGKFPMFCSRYLDGALPFVPSEKVLSRLKDKSALAKMIVFDSWIRNGDRLSSNGQNFNNILILNNKSSFSLWLIDHTHAFGEYDPGAELGQEWIDEQVVYGYRDEFLPHLRRSELIEACCMATSVSREQLEAIAGSVPAVWGVSQATKDELVKCLLERAKRLQSWLPASIFGQFEMEI